MIERLVAFSLRQKALILVTVLFMAGLGVWSFLRLPIDAFPDVTNIQVEVICSAPGRSPLEVEKFVTYPVESALRGLPHLTGLRSVSKFGLSVITAVFEDGVDIFFARQLVLERLIGARDALADDVDVEMGPVATAMGEIYQYTIEEGTSGPPDQARLTELRTLQDWVVSPMLKTVPGVSEVNSFGGYIKQYQVVADPDRLQKYDIALADVVEALRRNNQNVGGGLIQTTSEQYLVRGLGLLRDVDDIRSVSVKTWRGVPVLIRDVAEVRVGAVVRQGASVKNGEREVVGGIVMMLRGANARDVVEGIEAKVAGINGSRVLPAGMAIVPFYKRSDIVRQSVHTVTDALLVGGLFVVFILYLFLRNLRGAVIVIAALPLAALATFIIMKRAGLTANLMSLGGLAISVGMIIDATIIQVENVQRRLAETAVSLPKPTAVLQAVLEVRRPSIFGELIIALTFIPIMTLQGIEGKMFAPLALTVSIALLASLVLSIFVIPVLSLLLLRRSAERRNRVMEMLTSAYSRLLRWTLRRKALVLSAALLMLAGSLLLIPRLGTEFIPAMDEGAFDMDIQLLPGVSLDRSLAISKEVERRLKQFPELETIVSRTGQTGIALEARGVEKTGYVGTIRPRREWTSAKTRDELTNKMREAMEVFPGMAFSFSQPIACRIDELVAGTRAQIIIRLFGEDLETLRAKADAIGRVIAGLRGVRDIVVESVAGQPYVTIAADRARIARYGINVADVQDVIATAVAGSPVTRIYEGDKSFDVAVLFPESWRDSVGGLARILVPSPQGARVPLGELASISLEEGPSQISREFGQRRIGIECNVSGRDIGGFVAEARREIRKRVELPAGYYLEWGGQFENQQRAMRRLALILPLTAGLIFFLLFVTFGTARLAVLVFLNLPFALIGGVASLYLSGLYLSVPASVGFIALFGIAVLNGVVLVSTISQCRQEGTALDEAIAGGCARRLRPVLMTASITVFSLLPLLAAQGPGSEIQRPLAVVVVGGLLTSTLLTLLVLPALYGWFEGRRGRGRVSSS